MVTQSDSVTLYLNPACGTSRHVLARPILIQRPLVVTPAGVKLCRPPGNVLELSPRS